MKDMFCIKSLFIIFFKKKKTPFSYFKYVNNYLEKKNNCCLALLGNTNV